MQSPAWNQNRKLRRAYARMAHRGTANSQAKVRYYAIHHVTRRHAWEEDRRAYDNPYQSIY